MELPDSAHTVARMNAAMGAGKTGMSGYGAHFDVRNATTLCLKLRGELT